MRDYYSSIYKGLIAALLFSIANIGFAQSVRINEFMALNQTVLTDEDNEYSDWIEIFNAGITSVNMKGWALTDEKTISMKWIFPEITINAGEYLVVFASGKDRSVTVSELHTNFKLSGTGEFLALYNAVGTAVTSFDPMYPAQMDDYSYGFYENNYVEFADPSPGKSNDVSIEIVTPAPTFSVEHGFFESPFGLNISSTISGAKIYYTQDGSTPDKNNGKLYTSSVWIPTTSIIRAVAIVDDAQPSQITTQTYLFLNDVIQQSNTPEGYPSEWGPYSTISGNAIADYEMDPELVNDAGFASVLKESLKDIPTVSLVTDKDNFFSHDKDPETGGIYIYTGSPAGDPIGRGWERPISFEYFDPNSSESLHVDCGVRLQGGHGRVPEKLPKHSFLLTFDSDYGPSKLDHAFFGEDGSGNYDKLILRGGFGNSWIHHSAAERNRAQYQRDIWTKDTQRDMGHPASNSTYVHLYINGLYWGIYAPSERMDADFGAKYFGGKADDYDVIKDKTELADGEFTAWNKLLDMANAGLADNDAYQRIQGNNPDGTPNPEIESMVDVVNLADYMLINFYGTNTDWDHHNWAVMRNRVNPGKGFKFLCWDGEHNLESVNASVLDENNDQCPSRIFQQLMKNEDYKRLFADRIQLHCLNGGALTAEATAERWKKRTEELKHSIYAESARWGDYRRDVHPYQTVGPFDLYTYEDHWIPQQNFMMNTYFPQRTDAFLDQLRKKGLFPNVEAPVFMIYNHLPKSNVISRGAQLSMTTSEGSIYYTTNGTDPAQWQTVSGGGATSFIEENATKKVLVPKQDIGTNWYSNIHFDDSAWQICSGLPGGVGYETSSGYEDLISLNVQNEMTSSGPNPNASCYIRIPFTLDSDDISGLTSLMLKMSYDDGFVAYLNGKEVAKVNMPGTIQWNSLSQGSHEAGSAESINITEFINLLIAGDNVLAIQGANQNTTSSDFIINATLVGSDVPLAGGISSEAIQYTSNFALTQSVHLFARTFHNGEWSAASKQFFIVPDDYKDLKITEIHYNPLSEDSIDGSEFEFIELKNTGTANLSLQGLQFIAGIDYKFTSETQLDPEEFIVLASNKLDFYTRYGFGAYDEYKGKLDNNGEWLVLVSASNDTISAFRYNDAGDWPVAPDGEGYSLVPMLFNPENDQSNAADWRSSYLIGGSPGADDLKPDNGNDVVISKLTPNDDLVRDHNYPNPFTSICYIDYQLPEDASVQLSIYNMTGQQIASLVNENQGQGLYQIEWTGIDQRNNKVPAGIYFYRLMVQSPNLNYMSTKKMMFIR
ncbi:MAG: lamin tail domain-containing protein [Prolixibacteraceae bacterium]